MQNGSSFQGLTSASLLNWISVDKGWIAVCLCQLHWSRPVSGSFMYVKPKFQSGVTLWTSQTNDWSRSFHLHVWPLPRVDLRPAYKVSSFGYWKTDTRPETNSSESESEYLQLSVKIWRSRRLGSYFRKCRAADEPRKGFQGMFIQGPVPH